MHQRLKNLWGEEIISSIQYLSSKRDLERDLRKSPFRIGNLYGGGVVIDGAPATTLDEARTGGLLSSAPGSRERFLQFLATARTQGHAMEEISSLDALTDELAKGDVIFAIKKRKWDSWKNRPQTGLERVALQWLAGQDYYIVASRRAEVLPALQNPPPSE